MSDVQKEIRRLDDEIMKLKREREKLSEVEKAEYLEDAKENIGRCFRNFNKTFYCKVVDVPQEEWDQSFKRHFKRDFYPVFCINLDENVPFYDDEACIVDKKPRNFDMIMEITKEEFEKVFLETIEEFKKKILK